MKIILLGTGTSQGVPVIGCGCEVCRSEDEHDKRLRTSALIIKEDTRVAVDVGPDFRQQMLRYNEGHLDGILLTHEHNDHVAGLDDIRPYNFNYKMDFPLYGLPRVLENIKNRYAYIFLADKYPGSPSVVLRAVVPWEKFQIGNLSVRALPVRHGSLDILGYSFDDRLAYLTDVRYLDPEVTEYLEDFEYLVISALHHRPHHSHLNLEQALQMIGEIHPRESALIHMSHHMGLYEKVRGYLPENVNLGYDGMEIFL